ncbi:alpha/beta hydrolase [Aeromicrobium sp.]|uniref:alpha/beta hydrolase n=1 Tax=Aeromicrobium sp. TaxID=1871063 RepID=UPI0030C0A8EA
MPDTDLPFERIETNFSSNGVGCAATVFKPESEDSTRPAIVMAHGFGSPRAVRLYAYAERFAAVGYVVVVFDYRGFGDSEGHPRQVLDIRMQHDDWRAALRFTRALSCVDSDAVVAWGTSFGGGHVITLAGLGEPLAALIAQVPHVSGLAAVRSTGVRASLRLAFPSIRDQIAAWMRRTPVYVNSVGAPGEVAIMTTPDALPGMHRLLDESALQEGDYPKTVAARIVLKIGLYSPGRRAAAVACPALIQIATDDAITPRLVAEAAATKMPLSTVRTYAGGHFDPYVGELFEIVVADQIEFLNQHTPTAPSAQRN